jgi:hypothetical protein
MLYRIILIIGIITLTFYNSYSQDNSLKKIEIFYTPWDILPYGRLSNNDVRELDKYKREFIVQNDSIENEFLEALSIFNLRIFEKDTIMDVRMVIDFYFEDGIKTISLDKNKSIKYNNNIYFQNHKLNCILDKYLP